MTHKDWEVEKQLGATEVWTDGGRRYRTFRLAKIMHPLGKPTFMLLYTRGEDSSLGGIARSISLFGYRTATSESLASYSKWSKILDLPKATETLIRWHNLATKAGFTKVGEYKNS